MLNENNSLNIFMNKILVGSLEKTSNLGLIFTYAQSWLEHPASRPLSLSLPLQTQPFTGNFVFNFFDNLLPEDKDLRVRIQARFQIKSNHIFDLLTALGKDCVGAIQCLPPSHNLTSKKISFKKISTEELADLLKNIRINPLGMNNLVNDYRISLAGVQEKAAFLYHDDSWCIPLEDTPTTHIFKLPLGYLSSHQFEFKNSCENEWLCAQLAAAFGLPVAECEIASFSKEKALIVKRFDRKIISSEQGILRIPQEDICQAFGFSAQQKYEADGGPGVKQIMDLLLNSTEPIKDRDYFFQTQILFWLLGAIDGHAKNFSLFIEPKGGFKLTPLYDILSIYPLVFSHELDIHKVKMAMSLKGKNNDYQLNKLQRRYFLQTALCCGYPEERADSILETMLSKVDSVIKDVSGKLPSNFPQDVAAPIFEGLQQTRDRLSI